MKPYNYALLFLTVFLLSNCQMPIRESKLILTLNKQGYTKGLVKEKQYITSYSDTVEANYYLQFLKNNRQNRSAFFSFPAVKDKIEIFVGVPGIHFRKAHGCIDTIDVYIDNKLYHTGLYPYTLGCRSNYPNLPTHPEFIYGNIHKVKTVHIIVVFQKDKVYLDTIIPLRFKKILIFYNLPREDFFISFEGALN